MNTKVMY